MLDEGMIGLAFTNGSPYVAPTRSATQLLSTLPIALAVPANNGKRVPYIYSSNYIEVLHSSCPPYP